MAKEKLHAGIEHEETMCVGSDLTVPAFSQHFSGFESMPPVFATAMLVAFAEWTCMQALEPYLDDGEKTVGSHVELSHLAATPVGMSVTAKVEIVAIDKRRLRFAVLCRDEVDTISCGFHERVIVDSERFLLSLARKTPRGTA